MFDSWQQLMDEYGGTEEQLDDLFDQPWPGQYGYEDDDPENDVEADDTADAEGTPE